jgi:hypothetical protein
VPIPPSTRLGAFEEDARAGIGEARRGDYAQEARIQIRTMQVDAWLKWNGISLAFLVMCRQKRWDDIYIPSSHAHRMEMG